MRQVWSWASSSPERSASLAMSQAVPQSPIWKDALMIWSTHTLEASRGFGKLTHIINQFYGSGIMSPHWI